MKLFSTWILGCAYAVITKISLETYTVRQLYDYYRYRAIQKDPFADKYANEEWTQICLNLNTLRYNSMLQTQLFLQIYNLEYYNVNLYKMGISSTDLDKM